VSSPCLFRSSSPHPAWRIPVVLLREGAARLEPMPAALLRARVRVDATARPAAASWDSRARPPADAIRPLWLGHYPEATVRIASPVSALCRSQSLTASLRIGAGTGSCPVGPLDSKRSLRIDEDGFSSSVALSSCDSAGVSKSLAKPAPLSSSGEVRMLTTSPLALARNELIADFLHVRRVWRELASHPSRRRTSK